MVVLLDGGFSSQIKNYVDEQVMVDSPLWSAQFLASNPEAVLRTHSDYIEAGCDVVTTNTYQASIDGFRQHLGLDFNSSITLIKEAVQLAYKAIHKSANGRQILVAGSVGPYGACLSDGSEYRGDYIEHMTTEQLTYWHRPRISALVEAGVDLLAVETVPALKEAIVILELLKNEFPNQKAWVSFSCKDEKHISHGEQFSEVVLQCCQVNREQLLAIGVNCLAPELVTPLLTSVQAQPVPFVVYPNSGEMWKPGIGWTINEECLPLPLSHYLSDWISLGAQYIGGCCRTTTDDIKLCREYIDSHHL